jgi:anti-sigma-K factor RskA
MNAQEIIASGALEAYVLGEGTTEERALIERMRTTDADVRAELEAIEVALEAHARSISKAPPVRVRAAVMGAIAAETRVRPMTPAPQSSAQRFNWLAAASIGALLLSGVGNWMQWSELRQVRERLAGSENERTVLAEQMEVQKASLTASENELAVLTDPSVRMVELAGTDNAPKAKARIYWDPASREVHMGVATLPAPPAGMQYQLWAIVDGLPVDAGTMPLTDDGTRLHRMKDIGPAQAFAVTLEKAGGVPAPTLTAMVLMGQTG